jgi:hypothetical protein
VTDVQQLKRAITGLLGFAATEAQIRLATSISGERGNLACALARAGRLDDAAATVRKTVALHSGLRAKLGTEPDLAAHGEAGLLESAGV